MSQLNHVKQKALPAARFASRAVHSVGHMASPDADETWLLDSITGFLRGPAWALPVMSFIDENCIIFDGDAEHKFAYTAIYEAFKELVDSLLEAHLQDIGVSNVCSPPPSSYRPARVHQNMRPLGAICGGG